MKNSNFSNLIYRIIGKPDRWHDDYIDLMNQVLDETDFIEDPDNFSELALGDQILTRLSSTNEALTAFYTLLDRNRFQMIILDDTLSPIFRNKSAETLLDSLLLPVTTEKQKQSLDPIFLKQLKLAINKNEQSISDTPQLGEHLCTIDYKTKNEQQLYLRSIQRQPAGNKRGGAKVIRFYVIMMLDKERDKGDLNPELVSLYQLTDREQMVLMNLVQGKSIKDIAQEKFVTENTVKTHVKSLFRKTGASSQADIVRIVLTHESQVLDSYFDTNPGILDESDSKGDDKTIKLSDGQVIVYREYGPKSGSPVIVFHNGFGSRLSIPQNYQTICNRANKRIIIPDRPGFGKSQTSKKHPSNWHKQLVKFIDQLGINEYEILGNVLGCPLAIEYAVNADDRLQRLILASPVMLNTRKDERYLRGIFRPSARLVRSSKRFAREIYELWLKSITLNLGTHYRNMVEDSLGDNEHNINNDKEAFLDLLVDAFRGGISESLHGISSEMVYCLTPMKLDLSRICVPVDIWWGTQDARIARGGVENLAAQLTNATVHIEEGYSEHIYYGLFEQIISSSYSCDAQKIR